MKKLTTLFLVLGTALLLTACGGGGGSSSSDSRDPSAGSVTLHWSAPATRSDGSFLPANELQGYRVYYGTSETDLNLLVDLNDDSATQYTVATLPTGSYYFAVTAYDSDGTESGLSNVVNKDV